MKKKNDAFLNFAHICDLAFISNDGKLSIIGIFQTIQASTLPFLHPRITCAVNVSIQQTTVIKIQIVHARTKELITKLEGRLQMPDTKQEIVDVGFMGNFQNIRFEQNGGYECEIWLDNVLERSLPFFVKYTNKPS